MRLRKLLALVLAMVMLVSSVPTAVFATETDSASSSESEVPAVVNPDNLFVDKTVTLTEDGTYSINMEAYATGTPITKTVELGVPLDVVLVVDQSGSLKNSGSVDFMKNSIRDFMNALKANGEAVGVDHRVSICSFAGDDLGGLSGPADETYGYSFAGDLWDLAWLNTGLYVDGKFQDYGTVEYTRIDSLDNLDTTRSYLVKYTRTLENGSSVAEYFRIYYYKNYGSWYINNGKKGLVSLATRKQDGNNKTTSEELIANYEVYDIGESTLQLDPTDYAASWEYIADGQGNLNADVAAAINSLASNGGTRTSYGLKMARNMLKYITPGTDNDIRKKVVVVFTDGKAGSGWDNDGEMAATLAEANKIKDSGVDIYTVGVYNDDVATDIASFMNQFSSNCGVIEFSENPTTEWDYNNLNKNTWANSVTGRYRTLPSFYKVENEDGTVEFCPVRVRVETRYSDAAKDWVVTPPYKWTYITDTGEMPIPTELLNEDGTAITGLYKIGSGDYNSEAGYYQTSNSFDNLSSLFQTVLDKETIFSSEVELDANAILKDVMADGFKLTDNTTITVSVVPGSVSEENKNLAADELTKDKITWGEAQQVLTFAYPTESSGTGTVTVGEETSMTIIAKAGEDGVVTATGFDYANQYVSYGHDGYKLVVTITGVEATSDVVTDGVTATNQGTSGIYEPEDSDADEDGEKGEIQASFPIPTTYLTSKVYVVDYAKPMTIDPADFKMTEAAESLDVDGYNYFNPALTAITETYGKVAVADGKITYKPTNTNWDGYDTFYVFGTTDDATIKAATANANGNMWSKVSVIPANNVYYEDTFVTDEETGTAGIVYSGTWIEDDTAGNQGENAESGEDTTADGAQGGVHGWEDSLADDNGYSDGSAHMVSYDKNSSATATFTFTGTGVDIYSRTNEKTGIVIAMLYKGTSTTDENGKNLVAEKTLMVDNLAASGDYYQIPTLSFNDLDHGTYTVKLIVSKASASQTGAERLTYYLDGIRVYNPIQNLEGNDTVSDAYGEEELNATFVEIRDKLLDANSFSAEEDGMSAGPVFIDRITSEEGEHTDNTETWEVGTYKVFGPENEVYLSAMQMIAFAVEYREGAHYYIGMKSLTGEPAGVFLSDAYGGMQTISIGHTTDLYYEVQPVWEYDEDGNPTIGYISVMTDFAMDENGDYIMDENGDYTYEDSILALTKLKVTGPKTTAFKFARVRNADLLSYAEEVINSDDSDAPSNGEDTEDSESGETTDPTEPSTPDVDIDNPEPETPKEDKYKAEIEQMYNVIKWIYNNLRRWFGR